MTFCDLSWPRSTSGRWQQAGFRVVPSRFVIPLAEESAQAMFRLHADHKFDHDAKTVYRCVVSERVIGYPETLYGSRQCSK